MDRTFYIPASIRYYAPSIATLFPRDDPPDLSCLVCGEPWWPMAKERIYNSAQRNPLLQVGYADMLLWEMIWEARNNVR